MISEQRTPWSGSRILAVTGDLLLILYGLPYLYLLVFHPRATLGSEVAWLINNPVLAVGTLGPPLSALANLMAWRLGNKLAIIMTALLPFCIIIIGFPKLVYLAVVAAPGSILLVLSLLGMLLRLV